MIHNFESKYTPEPNTGCWLWSAAVDQDGYALALCAGKTCRVSRVLSGASKGIVVRHKCDTPSCVNPEHLTTGKNKDNTADMVARGRAAWQTGATVSANKPKDSCPKGHPYSGDNLYERSERRYCKSCKKSRVP